MDPGPDVAHSQADPADDSTGDPDGMFNGADLAQFLAANNWTCQADRSYDQVWLPPVDAGDFVRPVLVPREPAFVDYAKRLSEAAAGVAAFFGWRIGHLAEQVAAVHADLFFVRLNQVSTDGTIPLRQATALLDNIDQMIRSAAVTTWNPKSSGRGRTPLIVNDFLTDDVRMGHTKKGSFIITVAARLDDVAGLDRAPAHPAGHEPATTSSESSSVADSTDAVESLTDAAGDEGTGVAEEPVAAETSDEQAVPSFTRRVMTTLARSLTYAREQSLPEEANTTFEVAVEEGLRLPVVQALREIGSAEGLQSLDMSFEWAEIEPARQALPTRVTIDRDVIEALPTVEARLARSTAPARVTLVGPVSELKRSEDDPDAEESGEIVVQAEVEGRVRKVTVPLTGSDYDWAIQAHRARLPFTVAGELGKKGNSWRLNDPIEVDRSFLEFRLSRE